MKHLATQTSVKECVILKSLMDYWLTTNMMPPLQQASLLYFLTPSYIKDWKWKHLRTCIV